MKPGLSMTDKTGLDRIDLKILDILQRDGRLPSSACPSR
jgi:DNA-binding Lrp family transcriptional regulator